MEYGKDHKKGMEYKESSIVSKHRKFLKTRKSANMQGMKYPQARTSKQIGKGAKVLSLAGSQAYGTGVMAYSGASKKK